MLGEFNNFPTLYSTTTTPYPAKLSQSPIQNRHEICELAQLKDTKEGRKQAREI